MSAYQASVVIPEALELKEWRGCLATLGKKVNVMSGKDFLCWGCEIGHTLTQAAIPEVPRADWRPEAIGT